VKFLCATRPIVVTTPEGKSERVRLIGIDCPESKPNDKAKRDSERTGKDLETINKMGLEATETLKEVFKIYGNEVVLKFDAQERDKYGRSLAYVFYDTGIKEGDAMGYKSPVGYHFDYYKVCIPFFY